MMAQSTATSRLCREELGVKRFCNELINELGQEEFETLVENIMTRLGIVETEQEERE